MFIHMVFIRKETHKARGKDYELFVYQVRETGEYRVYVAEGGLGLGDIYVVARDVADDAKREKGVDLVMELLQIARDDIDRNAFDQF